MSEGTNAGVGGGAHPAQSNQIAQPASPPPEMHQPAQPDRTRGVSPALDQRREAAARQQGQDGGQQAPGAPQTFTIDGVDYTADQVKGAIAHQLEHGARKSALPQTPADYQIQLPRDFHEPQGAPRFEFDANSPELKRFRELAHSRGIDQETFSDMLGVYAANRISEQQVLAKARTAQLGQLGSAAPQRIDAVTTWLKARVGAKGAVMAAQLRNFPHAGMVEMFEGIMREFSGHGGAEYRQDGRYSEPANDGRISGYENMTFEQRRAAQDARSRRG